jgi:hypothetical protein
MAGPSNPQQPNVASDFAMLAERCIQKPFMTSRGNPQSGRTSRATAPLTCAAASLGATLTPDDVTIARTGLRPP